MLSHVPQEFFVNNGIELNVEEKTITITHLKRKIRYQYRYVPPGKVVGIAFYSTDDGKCLAVIRRDVIASEISTNMNFSTKIMNFITSSVVNEELGRLGYAHVC